MKKNKNSEEKVIIFEMDNCPPCEALKKDIKERDKVEFRNVDKDKEALNLALKHGLKNAPSTLLKTAKGYQKCDIYFDHKLGKVVVECEDKKIEL